MTFSTLDSSTPVLAAFDGRNATSAPPAYLEMLREDRHENPPAFLHATSRLFEGIDLKGKRVLEIGSGKGLLALYVGLKGAAHVVSMEPELVGSTSGVIAVQRRRIAALRTSNVEVVAADFNTWDPAGARFDVILSRASINHLYESRHHALHERVTYENYLRIARKIRDLMAPGGIFIATDASRYGFFTLTRRLGIRRPWRWQRSTVDWRYHQNPSTWARIFDEAGFSRIAVQYPLPYRLRHVGALADNAVTNFFLNGAFVFKAYR